MIATIAWQDDTVVMLDQRLLPEQEVYRVYDGYLGVAEAIRSMVIRGAPAIGIAAAMGIALGAQSLETNDPVTWRDHFETILAAIQQTRPTAVNLFWAAERMKSMAYTFWPDAVGDIAAALKQEAITMLAEDIASNQRMGKIGQTLLSDGDVVLTHCNAGALATGGYGTALGVIRAAWEAGKRVSVIADETRPFLQGARLTAWELLQDHIPVTLITDNMAGYCMQRGLINAVITGADRIAANGDAANKIGTYSVAVLAAHHNIPLFIAAPMSTIDFKTVSGEQIPIEERAADEVRKIQGKIIAPPQVPVRNPAFDVTPARLIKAIITEKGIATAPFSDSLENLRTLC